MSTTSNPYQAAIDTLLLFFVVDKKGANVKQDLLQFIDVHIDAMKRHNQDPHVIQILEAFAAELLGLSNIDTASLRESLRLQMTWNAQSKP